MGLSISSAGPPGRRQRILVPLAADIYVRNVLTSGALDELAASEGHELVLVASDTGVRHERAALERRLDFAGYVEDPPDRAVLHGRLEVLLRLSRRSRSRTLAQRSARIPAAKRAVLAIASRPRIRPLVAAVLRWRHGRSRPAIELVDRVAPDLVLAPTGGNDALVNDVIAAARERGVPSVALIHNWDGLTTKGALPVPPDHVAVWSEQGRQHARRLLGLPDGRIHVLGSPALDPLFRATAGAPSPFESPYVLFAGCYAPFDERRAVEAIDDAIGRAALDLVLVYRPHPDRAPRRVSDRLDERRLRHTIIDPALRANYEGSFGPERDRHRYPELDTYPPLLEHARFVVTPLSTMLLEAAIAGRRVLVLAYDDGIHAEAPHVVATYDHVEGLAELPRMRFVRTASNLGPAFMDMAAEADDNGERADLSWWVHHDERPYGARLLALVADLAPMR